MNLKNGNIYNDDIYTKGIMNAKTVDLIIELCLRVLSLMAMISIFLLRFIHDDLILGFLIRLNVMDLESSMNYLQITYVLYSFTVVVVFI